MSVSRKLAVALGAAMILAGAASEAQADRNRYTRLRPGQRYYGYHRHFGPRFAPYGYGGYGYGYRRPYGFGGYGYGPRYGGPYQPY